MAKTLKPAGPFVTGMGVVSALGQGKVKFADALLNGRGAFGILSRPGRQQGTSFAGAEIPEMVFPASITLQTQRAASLSAQAALLALEEAWVEAKLFNVDPRRIGLIVGGSNIQQREQMLLHERYRDRPQFVRPSYGLSFLDSDLCGFCTKQFGIRGPAYTVGGASASGQLAIVQAAQAVLSGEVDVCVAIGALMDLSWWELSGLRALGAMGSDRFPNQPMLACRPFDRDHDGFIFGECCGAVVLEQPDFSRNRGQRSRAELRGWGITMDANRNPDPSLAGEMRAIQSALEASGWKASEVDYINPHGTGSPLGDETELKAIHGCGLAGARLNATKSLVGHGLSAAGTVEVIATLLQMEAGQLHPTRNLEVPIDTTLNWVTTQPEAHVMQKALTLSMGFGGINTALCWQRLDG